MHTPYVVVVVLQELDLCDRTHTYIYKIRSLTKVLTRCFVVVVLQGFWTSVTASSCVDYTRKLKVHTRDAVAVLQDCNISVTIFERRSELTAYIYIYIYISVLRLLDL